jgi:hypothetical protein
VTRFPRRLLVAALLALPLVATTIAPADTVSSGKCAAQFVENQATVLSLCPINVTWHASFVVVSGTTLARSRVSLGFYGLDRRQQLLLQRRVRVFVGKHQLSLTFPRRDFGARIRYLEVFVGAFTDSVIHGDVFTFVRPGVSCDSIPNCFHPAS